MEKKWFEEIIKFTFMLLEHQYWWCQKFNNLVPQKDILSILPSHFIKHPT